jgi:hypothetical protein
MAGVLGTIGGRGKSGATGITWITGIESDRQRYTFGGGESLTQGNPAAPSLSLPFPGSFRFRFVARPGTHTIQINCMQAANVSPRPSMIVRANTVVGLSSDQTAVAPSGTGWVVIGPIVMTFSALGAVYVDLCSNSTAELAAPCYFDHIVAT